ncbi:MAG: DUF4912 domain-containing protein [Deltaproteobacteria bacterium]|nr:DUF4912 domain-containing protein [Deltaproteobacteria bacterium]
MSDSSQLPVSVPLATSAPVRLPDVPPGTTNAASSSDLAASHAPGVELPTHPGVPLSPAGIPAESDVRTHAPGAAAKPHHPPEWDVAALGELPSGYGDGRLVALVRDPSTLFVYWDLSQHQLEQSFLGLGQARAILKLLSLRGELVREQEIQLEARGWYIRQLPQAAELKIELWALGEKGARLLRASRPLRLPVAQPSGDTTASYATVPVDAPLPSELSTGPARTFDPALGAAWLEKQRLEQLIAAEADRLRREGKDARDARLGYGALANGSGVANGSGSGNT